MAWNQPGRKPGKDAEHGRALRRGPGAPGGDGDDPPGLEKALERLNQFFSIRPARLLLLGLAALLLVVLAVGFHQVGVGEQTVVLRAGRLQDVQGPGLHWNIPLLDQVRTVSVARIRDATLSADVITRDEDLLALGVVLHYRIEDPVTYLLRFGDAEAALLRVAESVLQETAAGLASAELAAGPAEQLSPGLQERIAQRLARYRSGLVLTGLSVASVQPPADLRGAFADVQRAGEEARLVAARAEQAQRQAQQAAQAEVAKLQAVAVQKKEQRIRAAREEAAQFAQALAAYRRSPEAVAQQLYDEAVGDVLRRTQTVILGEQGLAPLGIATQSLTPAPLPLLPGPRP